MSVDFRIIDFNYVFQSNVTLAPSSEDVDFPASNLRNFLRSKVWRTTGTYVIVAGANDKLNFEDVAATELTATLTAGTFTATTLAAEIKTQMEAVGVNTYTITFGSDGRWTIATSGGFLTLLWAGTDAATSVGPSIGWVSGSLDDTGSTSYQSPSIAIHTSEFIDIDLNTSEEIDSFGMFWDPNLGSTFSTEATFQLQASATPVFTSPPVDVTLSFNDDLESITHYFTSDQEFRFWRVTFTDPRNTNLKLEIPKIFLGRKIQISKAPQRALAFSHRDLTSLDEGLFGHEYADEFPIKRSLDFNLIHLTNDESELMWNSYLRNGVTTPIVISIDSTEKVFNKDRFTMYGRYQSQIRSTSVVRDLMNWPLSIVEKF